MIISNKKAGAGLVILIIFIGTFFNLISAEVESFECISDIQCAKQGQYSGVIINDMTYKVKERCINNKCVSEELIKVECIPPNIGCASYQVCVDFECRGGYAQIKKVECTSHLDCGLNQFCDTLLYKCVDALSGEIITTSDLSEIQKEAPAFYTKASFLYPIIIILLILLVYFIIKSTKKK